MLLGIAAKEIDLFPDITLFLRFRSKQKKEQSLATWFIWQNFASVPVFIRARSKLIKIWGPLTRQFLQRNTHQEQRFWHTFLCRFARSFAYFTRLQQILMTLHFVDLVNLAWYVELWNWVFVYLKITNHS